MNHCPTLDEFSSIFLDPFLKVKELTLHKSKIIPCYLGFLNCHSMINVCFLDGVKAERYQDAMMRAREKMQHSLDEQTAIRQTKVEEVWF